MSIIQGNAHQSSTRGFYPKVINGSLRFNDDDNAYLSWTPTSAGNRKTWTFSCWAKRGEVSNADNVLFGTAAEGDKLAFGDSRIFWFQNGSSSSYLSTSALFRDPSAWYHIVFALDTTQATAANRCKLWVNGESVAFDNNTTFPTQNYDGDINNTEANFIGRGHSGDNGTFDGYLANVHFIDGQALTADDFGETKNGVWVAKDYAGTFGTNGFYLTFEDDTEVEAFNTVLYRSQQPSLGVTGVGFKPDLVITKTRGISSGSTVMDSVRGASAMLSTASTGAESTTGGKGIISFDSDGFTLGTDADIGSSNYSNGTDYVAWCWDAGANNAVTGHSSVTYSGNQTDGTKISGLPFTPDLVWLKERDSTSGHQLYDSVRGADYGLRSESTAAEFSLGEFGGFDKNGFIVNNSNGINQSGQTYVAWAWDAGDGDPVSNTDGSITSTVKASTTNGFSIVSYSGVAATDGSTNGGNPWGIGHGLTSAPDFVIYKMRTSSNGWYVYHSSLASTEHLRLDSTAAKATETVLFRDTPPDASELYVGGWDVVNRTGNDYIAYCWHDVTGKQKFGSYTGTGTAPSSLINTGFRPGFLMIKEADGVDGWGIYDGSRNPLNSVSYLLQAQDSGAESSATANYVDFESNGFKVCTGGSNGNFLNESGKTYIYAAFAGSYPDYITDYNTDGTNIDSRVKANQTTGFSIVSYEGSGTASDSFGHGLGTAPSMVIIKDRQLANSWLVQHSSVTGYLTLNSTNAVAGTDQLTFGASTVTLNGTWDIMNGSGRPYIAYCWAEKTGYSKFGSYTGTGSAGNAVTGLGFTPAWLLVRKTDGAGNWRIFDNTRDTDGTITKTLDAENSNAETDATTNEIVFDSNGFTVNGTAGSVNGSGNNFIYAAFADTREAAFWLDQSGNDNDWQPVNLDHNDTVADSPTNNFATMNPLNNPMGATLSDGNLKAVNVANDKCYFSTLAIKDNKFYFEVTLTTQGNRNLIGIIDTGVNPATTNPTADCTSMYAHQGNDRARDENGEQGSSSTGTWVTGDVITFAVDLSAGKIWVDKNQAPDITSTPDKSDLDTSLSYYVFCQEVGATVSTNTFNFGQQPFKYDPPE